MRCAEPVAGRALPDTEGQGLRERGGDGVLAAGAMVGVAGAEGEARRVADAEGDWETLRDRNDVGLSECDGDAAPLPELGDGEAVNEGGALGEREGVREGECVGVAHCEAHDADADTEPVRVIDGEGVPVAQRDTVALTEGLEEGDQLCVGVCVRVPHTVAVALTVLVVLPE